MKSNLAYHPNELESRIRTRAIKCIVYRRQFDLRIRGIRAGSVGSSIPVFIGAGFDLPVVEFLGFPAVTKWQLHQLLESNDGDMVSESNEADTIDQPVISQNKTNGSSCSRYHFYPQQQSAAPAPEPPPVLTDDTAYENS